MCHPTSDYAHLLGDPGSSSEELWPQPSEPCSRELECGRSCEADGYGGWVHEGQRGGNGYAVEDVMFECRCEHHQP